MANPENLNIRFSLKDIVREALHPFLKGDSASAIEIVAGAMNYNSAKMSGDRQQIREAYESLPPELKLLKKNFLNRGKKH